MVTAVDEMTMTDLYETLTNAVDVQLGVDIDETRIVADARMGNAAGETMSTAGLEMAPVGEAIAVADELPKKAADKEMLMKEIFDKLLGDLSGAAG